MILSFKGDLEYMDEAAHGRTSLFFFDAFRPLLALRCLPAAALFTPVSGASLLPGVTASDLLFRLTAASKRQKKEKGKIS